MKIALGPTVLALLGPQRICFGRRQLHFLQGLFLFAIMSLESETSPRLKILPSGLPWLLCCLRSVGGFASGNISSVCPFSVWVFFPPQFNEKTPSSYPCLHKSLPWGGGATSNRCSGYAGIHCRQSVHPNKSNQAPCQWLCWTLGAPILSPSYYINWVLWEGLRRYKSDSLEDLIKVRHLLLRKIHLFAFIEHLANNFERVTKPSQGTCKPQIKNLFLRCRLL